MLFSHQYKNKPENLQEYQFLEDEMSKYKTLNHENIAWDKVYESSAFILQFHCIEMKFCTYFLLACFHLNNEQCFHQLLLLLEHLKELSQNNTDFLKNQKKKLSDFIDNLINHFDKTKPQISTLSFHQFNELFLDFEKMLEYNFSKLQIKQPQSPAIKAPLSQATINTQSPHTNTASLNDREYKNFCQKLAFEFLENDENNLNAYALFAEAMWGRIKNLPEQKEGITQLRHPDRNLIRILLEEKEQAIQCFMSHLIVNPFWIEGIKLFCEFLEKHKKTMALKMLIMLTNDFVCRFEGITKLRFENGDLLCREEIFNYFVKQDTKESNFFKQKNKEEEPNEKDFEQILRDIDKENYNNSLMCNINVLMKLAKAFENKGMKKNATILYSQLIERMEKTLLKDYLFEEYKNIKEKIK